MITMNDINNSRPVLILYSSGTGGEFITLLLSQVSNEFNPLGGVTHNKKLNRTHVNCILNYSALWKDKDNPNAWVSPSVKKSMLGSKRYLLKDHPDVELTCVVKPKVIIKKGYLSDYKKYLPNITVLHLTMHDNYDYYAKVTFAKLQHKVLLDELNFDFMFNNITKATDNDLFNYVYNWASKYDWVWAHELQKITQMYLNKTDCSKFVHTDSIQTYIKEQALAIEKESNTASDQLLKTFENYIKIDITDITSSRKMWEQIKESINITDIETAIRKTDNWQERNRKLIA